ncbi:MAG: ral nucleoside transport system permease protein [Clostridia bacterium]|nr:ral nucleoside transport system permease protein [Clostridia bacterium]
MTGKLVVAIIAKLYRLYGVFTSILAILGALLIGVFIILANGDSPLVAYLAMYTGSFGDLYHLASTLANATPLIFTGLSVAVAFKAGVFNIGSEGQLYMGGIAAAVLGIYITGLPSAVHIPLALLGGFLLGGLFGVFPAILKVKTGADEVVTTIMANYVAILFTSYLVNYPLKPASAPMGMTRDIMASAKLPLLYSLSRLNLGFVLALITIVLIWVFFKYSVRGYECRMMGQNINFARYAGLRVNNNIILAMLISGGLAGLAGAVQVLGVQYRFVQDFSPGYGFDGITVSLMAGNNPFGILPAAILFGAMRAGGLAMELATKIPSELSSVLQALIILFVTARGSIASYFENKLASNEQKKQGAIPNLELKGGQ